MDLFLLSCCPTQFGRTVQQKITWVKKRNVFKHNDNRRTEQKKKQQRDKHVSAAAFFFFSSQPPRFENLEPKKPSTDKKNIFCPHEGLFYFLTFTESKTAHYRHRVKEKIKVNVFLLLIRREHNPHLMLLFFPQKWLVTKKSGFVVLSSEDFPHCTRLLFIALRFISFECADTCFAFFWRLVFLFIGFLKQA